jgi:hypothetical protein
MGSEKPCCFKDDAEAEETQPKDEDGKFAKSLMLGGEGSRVCALEEAASDWGGEEDSAPFMQRFA